MLGLFKKTSWAIDKKIKEFFQELFSQLPYEFHFLQEHLQKGLYRRYSINKANNYFITFDPEQSDQSMVKGKNFEIRNIRVLADGHPYQLDLTIYQGLWVGFDIPHNIKDFKNYRFDTTQVVKATSKFAADDKIKRLVQGLHSDQLDLDDLSEIEVGDKSYYQIKDLGNGDYIALDSKGKVYGLRHDPFTIKLLNKSARAFVESVNSGVIKLEEFLQH